MNGSLKYVLATVLMALICMGGVACVLVYAPPDQKVTLVTVVIAAFGLTTGQFVSILQQREIVAKADTAAGKAEIAAAKAVQTHDLVNGQAARLREQAEATAVLMARINFLEGKAVGNLEGRAAGVVAAHAEAEAMDKGFAQALPLTTKEQT